MMMDMESTVLCSTSSYALLLAEEIGKRGIRDKIHLKRVLSVRSVGVRKCVTGFPANWALNCMTFTV